MFTNTDAFAETETTHETWWNFYCSGAAAAGRDLRFGEADSPTQAAQAIGFLAGTQTHAAWWAGYLAKLVRDMEWAAWSATVVTP